MYKVGRKLLSSACHCRLLLKIEQDSRRGSTCTNNGPHSIQYNATSLLTAAARDGQRGTNVLEMLGAREDVDKTIRVTCALLKQVINSFAAGG